VVLVTISGFDHGEFRSATLDEISTEIARYKPIELFIDARNATGASRQVSDEWTAWFQSNQQALRRTRPSPWPSCSRGRAS
jgi:hypothetical protein